MTRIAQLDADTKQERLASLKGLMETANSEQANALTFLQGTSGLWPEERIIRSGSLDLDMCIGVGGWPVGRVVEIFGPESSGKTTLCLHTVREAQISGRDVVYIDAENALDPNYARKLGVDLDLILVNQPESLQQAQDLMVHVMNSYAEAASGKGLLIVVDSIPALAPIEVMQASAEQQTRAMAARYWSAQLPKIARTAAMTGTTILLINQLRDSMDQYTPASTPGGRAIKFFASVRCQISRRVDKGDGSGATNQECTIKVIKNKVGSPFKTAVFNIVPGDPIDWVEDVLASALYYEVVEEGVQYAWNKKAGEYDTIKKNNWFSYALQPGDLELIRDDERANHARAQAAAQREAKEEGKRFTPKEFESEFEDDDLYISVYRSGPFNEKMALYPSLIEKLEEQILDKLNVAIAEPDDIVAFDDEIELEDADEESVTEEDAAEVGA